MPRKKNSIIQILRPSNKISWQPTGLDSLATSGIYPQEDLQKLQQHIMFPMEKASLLNTIARGMQGEETVQGGILSNLLTENTLSNIAESTWHKFIEKLTKFGSISSAIIMIFIIIHILKLTMDIMIRGYTLHAMYGWTIHLLGAIFSSITNLLVVIRENEKQKIRRKEEFEDLELKEVVTEKGIDLKKKISPSRPIHSPNSNAVIEKNLIPQIESKFESHSSLFSLEPL